MLNSIRAFAVSACILTALAASTAADAEVEGMEPVMISLADREAPSDEEWEVLNDEPQRGLFGGLSDLESRTISFMDTRYFTPNCAEGTLASYGKMDDDKGFDRFGHIADVEFDVPSNSWRERYVLNAAALVKLTGRARFSQFAGVELDTAVEDRRQIEVTFVGTQVPKDEAIRRLNSDVEALEYLASLHEACQQYDNKRFKLLSGGSAPPTPRIVLSNVVMLDARSAQVFEGDVGGGVQTVIHGIGGDLRIARKTGEEKTLLTPVVRCYRTYAIEFKTDADGNLVRTRRRDAEGRSVPVPVVFDLTPDL